jgi:hypothetical protein
MALCFLMSLITSLGFLNIPSFLFPCAGVIIWVSFLMIIRKSEFRAVVVHFHLPFGAMTAVLTALFYTPVIVASNGVATIVSNRFVAGMPWEIFLSQLPLHIVSTFANFGRSVPHVLLLALLFLMIAGIYFSARKKNWDIMVLLPALLFGCAIPLFIQHNIPYARTWLYFLPFFFLLVDAGWLELSILVPAFYRPYLRGAVLLGIILWAFVLMNRDVIISSYPETGTFPEARAVVKVLSEEMVLHDKLVVGCPADAPVFFYMWYEGVPQKRATPSTHQKEFFVVKKSEYSLRDITKENARKFIVLGDAEVYVRGLPE